MGCDIHYVVERNVQGSWIGLFGKHPRAGLAGERDYEFFTELAGVRGSSKTQRYPQFIPAGISELALYEVTQYGSDGHSHSWMSVKDFSEIYMRVNPKQFERDWDKEHPWEVVFGKPYFLNRDEDKIEEYRVIFWFDN